MLVVHQFADKMIQDREEVISHRDRVSYSYCGWFRCSAQESHLSKRERKNMPIEFQRNISNLIFSGIKDADIAC